MPQAESRTTPPRPCNPPRGFSRAIDFTDAVLCAEVTFQASAQGRLFTGKANRSSLLRRSSAPCITPGRHGWSPAAPSPAARSRPAPLETDQARRTPQPVWCAPGDLRPRPPGAMFEATIGASQHGHPPSPHGDQPGEHPSQDQEEPRHRNHLSLKPTHRAMQQASLFRPSAREGRAAGFGSEINERKNPDGTVPPPARSPAEKPLVSWFSSAAPLLHRSCLVSYHSRRTVQPPRGEASLPGSPMAVAQRGPGACNRWCSSDPVPPPQVARAGVPLAGPLRGLRPTPGGEYAPQLGSCRSIPIPFFPA